MIKKMLILVLLCGFTSCISKTGIAPNRNAYFHDECSEGDSVYYFMNCTISENVSMQFIKKKVYTINEIVYEFGEKEYYFEQEEVSMSNDTYEFTWDEFKNELININKTNRITALAIWKENYRLQWKTIDDMLNFIKEN